MLQVIEAEPSNPETRNFWIQVKCPDLVRIWKIALRGRDTNTQMIYRWQLEASTDDVNFVTLFLAPNPTYLGNELQQFEVNTVHKYNCYRLLCLEAWDQAMGRLSGSRVR